MPPKTIEDWIAEATKQCLEKNKALDENELLRKRLAELTTRKKPSIEED